MSADHCVAESIVRWLVDAGVDTFFGIPGGPIISLFHRVLLHPGARLIESRHETGAAFAAMGYYRATGRVPGLLVTAGPGITNAVTGLSAALAERIPMIMLCGDVASDGRRLVQDLSAQGRGGVEELLGPITRTVRRVDRPQAALSELRVALQEARHPLRPGPAVVVIPVDRADALMPGPALTFSPSPAPTAQSPDPTTTDEVLRRLSAAKRPLLVLGAGCRGHSAQLRSLVDALGIPFMTSPQAKGIVSEEHPLSLRTGGMSASHWARRYCRPGADVALVLGSDLDDSSTAGTPVVGPDGAVLHVDTDPSVFSLNFPTAMAIDHPLESFAKALSARAHAAGFPLDGVALLGDTKERSPFDTPKFRSDNASPIAPHRAIADLERAAGPTDRFVTDIGEHMLFGLHYLTATDPDRFTIHLGLGSMGSGIGSSVGLALGDRSRRVICICGDGGMQMTGHELLVAVEHRLPLILAVFNDARYNMVYHGYRLTHDREEPWSTPAIDFVAWARALGVPGRQIDHPGQITAALLDELSAKGPAILDIRQDRDTRIAGDGRIEALRQMSFGPQHGADTSNEGMNR